MEYRDMVVPAEYPGAEMMGNNLRKTLKYCGEGVRLYPYCKMVRSQNASLDDGCMIWDHVYIDAGRGLQIGKKTLLTWNVLIEGGAKTYIGDRVFIGPGSKLITGTYELNGFYTSEYIPEECHKNRYGDIVIEDDAYIGVNAIIMPGTIIHEGAVVGAGCFARGELEPWTIYVGSPCRPVGKRERPSDDKKEILYSSFNWDNHLPMPNFDDK